MSPWIVVCLCWIILILWVHMLAVRRAVIAMTANQQRLYVCFRELLKNIAPDDEASLLKEVERIVEQ